MTRYNTSCLDCVHFRRKKWGTCDAFPDGIPDAITFGYVEHNIPLPNDNNIQFELLPELEPPVLYDWAMNNEDEDA